MYLMHPFPCVGFTYDKSSLAGRGGAPGHAKSKPMQIAIGPNLKL